MQTQTGTMKQQTARAGEYFVAAELNRRGAHAVTFSGNMPKADVLASSVDCTRTISIQVKTRRSGTWHTSIDESGRNKAGLVRTHFWVFVDLGKREAPPSYYVVPDHWMRNNIRRTHRDFLAKHGGRRPITPKSKHHAIGVKRIQQWKNRWDLLKLF